jgi:hypothetical protein
VFPQVSGKLTFPPAISPNYWLGRIALDVKCFFILIGVRIALITMGYSGISRRLPRPAERADSRFWGKQVGRRIERVARFVPKASCLTQALALQFILARAGHASRLQIGVREVDDGTFSAHAWVTCNGVVVLGQRGMHLADFKHIAERM